MKFYDAIIELYYKLLKHFVRTPKFINRLFSKSGKRIKKVEGK